MDGRLVDRAAAERLGRNVFKARRRAGYSQEELAELCCLHRTEVGMIEKAKRLPRVDTLIKLANVLDVGLDDLATGIAWTLPTPRGGGSFAVQKAGLAPPESG